MNEVLMNELIVKGVGILSLIVSGLITIGFAYLQSKVKSDKILNAVNLLEVAVKTTVGDLQNNIVEDWKRESKDGKLTEAQKQFLSSKYKALVYSRIDDVSKKILESQFEDLGGYIDGMVNSYISKLKASQPNHTTAYSDGTGVFIPYSNINGEKAPEVATLTTASSDVEANTSEQPSESNSNDRYTYGL